MGRIRVFLCAFCLDRDPDKAANDRTFNQDIDVSHLATPHVSSNFSLATRSSCNSTPACESNNNDKNYLNHHNHLQQEQAAVISDGANQHQQRNQLPEQPKQEREVSDEDALIPTQQQDDGHRQPSPQATSSSPSNLYDSNVPSQEPLHQQQHQQEHQHEHQQQEQQHAIIQGQSQRQQQALIYEAPTHRGTTRLSYDIISVREPLARILEERQLQQAQQLQRQNLGDHDYIEVYGERSSSCFYEEIAGSTTSSATYDQIGASSNHNYQVLINAYAVASRSNGSNQDESSYRLDAPNSSNSNDHGASQTENVYDVTYSSDQVDAVQSRMNYPQPSSSSFVRPSTSHQNHQTVKSYDQLDSQLAQIPNGKSSILSESIPVYSVINKATKRSNAIIRATVDRCCPPQPPPKNLMGIHQPSTSAIQFCPDPSSGLMSLSGNRSSFPIPTTSSYSNGISESNENPDRPTRLPRPPPRLSKLNALNTANRPLPLPESFSDLNEGGSVAERNQVHDEDIESASNGYELLTTNFYDDQIDVGYEKIRESNRYSGGSLNFQFRPLQSTDNGGYESVQPIYSSPSNALVEPNYEAIGPATASELAAAATARLTAAAAAAIEKFLKQDQ